MLEFCYYVFSFLIMKFDYLYLFVMQQEVSYRMNHLKCASS